MSTKLEEIRRKVAKLQKDAEELRRLKIACDTVKRFQQSIVDTRFD